MYPLHVASANPSLPTPLFAALINAHPAALAIPDGDRSLVLHNLSYLHRGSYDKMKIAIDSHPSVVAAEKSGDAKCLRHGGVRSKNKHGFLPLHYACGPGRQPILYVKMLWALYPEGLAAQDRAGRTPLHWAVDNAEPADVSTIATWDRTVLQIKDENDQLPIHYCFKSLSSPANYGMDVVGPFVEMLPSCIIVTDCDGKTPLDLAEALLVHAKKDLDDREKHESHISGQDLQRVKLLYDSVEFLRFRSGVGKASSGRLPAMSLFAASSSPTSDTPAAVWEWRDPQNENWFAFEDQSISDNIELAVKAGGGTASLIKIVGNGGFKIDIRGGDQGIATFLLTKETMLVRRRPTPTPTPSLLTILAVEPPQAAKLATPRPLLPLEPPQAAKLATPRTQLPPIEVGDDDAGVVLSAPPVKRQLGPNGGILTTPLTGTQVYVPDGGDVDWSSRLTVVEIDKKTVEKDVMAIAARLLHTPDTPKKFAAPVIRFEEEAGGVTEAARGSRQQPKNSKQSQLLPPLDAPPRKAQNVTVRLPIDSGGGSHLSAWAENDQGIWSVVPDSSITSINDHYATFAFNHLPHTLTATCDAVAVVDVVSVLAFRSELAAEGTTIIVCLVSNTSEQRILAEQVMARKKMMFIEESFEELRLKKNDVVNVKCEGGGAGSGAAIQLASKKYSNKRMSFEFAFVKSGLCIVRVSGGEDEEDIVLSLKFDVSLPKQPKMLKLKSRTNQTTLIKLDDFERQANARSYEVRIVKLSVRDRCAGGGAGNTAEFNDPESFDAKRWEVIEALAGEREWSIGGVFAAYTQVRAVNNFGASSWSDTLFISKEEAQKLLQERSVSSVGVMTTGGEEPRSEPRSELRSGTDDATPKTFPSNPSNSLQSSLSAYTDRCKELNAQAKLFTKACFALSGFVIMVIRKLSTLDTKTAYEEATMRNCGNAIQAALELLQSCSAAGWLSRLIVPPNPSWIRLFTERHEELITACVEAGAFDFCRFLDRTSEYFCDFDVDYHGLAREHFIDEFRKVDCEPLRIEHRIHDFCIDFGCCGYDDFRRELYSSSLAAAMKQFGGVAPLSGLAARAGDASEVQSGFVQAVGSPRNAIKQRGGGDNNNNNGGKMSMSPPSPLRGIFLSGVRHEVGRGSKTTNFLAKLCRSLHKQGYRDTFTSDDDHREGWSETLVESLDACILKCVVFVVVLSESSGDRSLSKQSVREYEIAKRQKKPIVVCNRMQDVARAKKAIQKYLVGVDLEGGESSRSSSVSLSSSPYVINFARDQDYESAVSELQRIFTEEGEFRIQPEQSCKGDDDDNSDAASSVAADSLAYGAFSDDAFDLTEEERRRHVKGGDPGDPDGAFHCMSPEVEQFFDKNGWTNLAPQLQYPSTISDLVRMNDPSQMEDLRALVLEKRLADNFCKKIEQLGKDAVAVEAAKAKGGGGGGDGGQNSSSNISGVAATTAARRKKNDVIRNASVAARMAVAKVQQSWDRDSAATRVADNRPQKTTASTDDSEAASSSLRLLSDTADYLESLDKSSKLDSLGPELTSKIESYVVKVDAVLKEIRLAVDELIKQKNSVRVTATTTQTGGSTSFFGFPNLAVLARNKLRGGGVAKTGSATSSGAIFPSARFEKSLASLTGQVDKLINLS